MKIKYYNNIKQKRCSVKHYNILDSCVRSENNSRNKHCRFNLFLFHNFPLHNTYFEKFYELVKHI